MRNRYEGDKGERLTLTQLKAQRLVQGDGSVAKALFAVGELNFPETGATVIDKPTFDHQCCWSEEWKELRRASCLRN